MRSFILAFLFLIFVSLSVYAQVNYTVIDSDPNKPGVGINSYSNHIVRDSQGNLYVGYSVATNQATHWYCFVRRSTDNGSTWEEAVRIENFPDSSGFNSLAVDSKDYLLVGFTFNVGTFFTMSKDGGKTWSSNKSFLDGGWGKWDWAPSVSVDSKDQIHAAFQSEFGWNTPPNNILYTTSSDGESFSTPIDLTKLPQDSSYGYGIYAANLQSGKNDELFIMARRSITSDADSYSVLIHYSNSQWLEPIKINDEGVYGSGGDFVIDSNGILHIFFAQIDNDTKKRRIFYKIYDPQAKTLSEGKPITPADENVMSISAGIYANDTIYLAYDLFNPEMNDNAGEYTGVYIRMSSDNFLKAYALSENMGARTPNLRGYYNNSYNKDRVDIVWVEPDTQSGGEMLVYYDLLNGVKPAGKVIIDVFVPYFMNPGQEATAVVRYNNQSGSDITNAVIVLDLPSDFQYLYSSNGGIYSSSAGRPQVFWRLGTLKDGQKGSEFVKFLIPWGMPDCSGIIVANLIGENIYSRYDSKAYYAIEDREPVDGKDLSEQELKEFLNSNKDVKELLDYSLKLGYSYNNVAQTVRLGNNQSITTIYLMDPQDYTPLFIKKVEGLPVYAEQVQGSVYTRFDTEGGYTVNSSDGSFVSFGKWAESHSLTEARCQLNCTINKVPGWITEAANKAYNMASAGIDCISCAKSKMKEVDACIKCLNSYKDVPGVGYAADVAQCLKECLENPNMHVCTEDLRECTWSVIGYLSGQDTVLITPCNKVTGTYDPISRRIFCAYGEECRDGQCVDKEDNPCGPKTIISPPVEAAVCKFDDFSVVPAHDPNAIYVEPDGDILPDELLTYTIEYENTGKGTAYDVFILNALDENLDETTLEINNDGKFSPYSRLLKWSIGTLEAGQKGSVSYRVKPKKGLATGTVISNFAEVHFPSAGEVTPTNIVASRINGISADNKRVSVNIGGSIKVKLTGRDISGKSPTFSIESSPKLGTIKLLNNEEVEYTAPSSMGGMDRFTYVAVVDGVKSNIATVSIEIQGEDKTPPYVINTNPEDKKNNVRFGVEPLLDSSYMPAILVFFNEEMDQHTFTTYSPSLIENGSSYIPFKSEYDNQRRMLVLRPLDPLKPSTDYEVILPDAISDRAGNRLESEYRFTFRTVSEKALDVRLSDNNSLLDFGKVQIKGKSERKTISLSSIGISAVTISEVKLKQSGKDFRIVEDKCSGKVLSPDQDCHIALEFSPETSGVKTAEITISSDDDTNKSIVVSLKGEGIADQTSDGGVQDGMGDGGSISTENKDEGGCGCTYIE